MLYSPSVVYDSDSVSALDSAEAAEEEVVDCVDVVRVAVLSVLYSSVLLVVSLALSDAEVDAE